VNEKKQFVLRLAREAVHMYAKENKVLLLPAWVPDFLLQEKAGVFVSIKKDNQLRGCIGTLRATRENLALEIIDMAIEASSKDPRFSRIHADELASLHYSVDVLGEPEAIEDQSFLDSQRYGIIVSSGFRRGVLLPNLEGVDSVEQQVSIALQKAGIHPQDDYQLERFEVIRYSEMEEDGSS